MSGAIERKVYSPPASNDGRFEVDAPVDQPPAPIAAAVESA